MKGPGVDQDAAVHMSSTLRGEGSPRLSVGICNALAEPACQAFLGQSFSSYPTPETHKQLFRASKGSRALHIICQRTHRAEEV